MIYVDELVGYGQAPKAGAERYFGRGKASCHMTCDGELEELHFAAEKIGLKRSWFQAGYTPHYDLTANKRALAVRLGAKEVSTEELVKMRMQVRIRERALSGREG